VEGWQKKARQDRNNSDHHQQLDERKPLFGGLARSPKTVISKLGCLHKCSGFEDNSRLPSVIFQEI
jgi:hypothetical protein